METPSHFTYRMGDKLRKKSGSDWSGTVVGWYSTEQTPEGYCIASKYHKNTVQLYPLAALELDSDWVGTNSSHRFSRTDS